MNGAEVLTESLLDHIHPYEFHTFYLSDFPMSRFHAERPLLTLNIDFRKPPGNNLYIYR